MDETSKQKLNQIKATIGTYPDFPKPGILFRDVFPLFYNPSVLEDTIQLMVDHIKAGEKKTDAIVGLDSRGFLFGPILSLRLSIPFIPIRKKGKLPGVVKTVSYELEYGTDQLEVQTQSVKSGMNYVIVDDLLATGGTLQAAVTLIRQCQGNVLESIVIIELLELKGRQKVDSPIFSLIQY